MLNNDDDDDDDDIKFQSSVTKILNHLTNSEAEYHLHNQLPSIKEVRTNLSAGMNDNSIGGSYCVIKNNNKNKTLHLIEYS